MQLDACKGWDSIAKHSSLPSCTSVPEVRDGHSKAPAGRISEGEGKTPVVFTNNDTTCGSDETRERESPGAMRVTFVTFHGKSPAELSSHDVICPMMYTSTVPLGCTHGVKKLKISIYLFCGPDEGNLTVWIAIKLIEFFF